jgi:hypothetical protein
VIAITGPSLVIRAHFDDALGGATKRMNAKYVLVLMSALTLLAGCGSGGGSATAENGKDGGATAPVEKKGPEIPADWAKFEAVGGAFSMAIPKNWMQIKPDGDTTTADMEKLKKVNPMLFGAWDASKKNDIVVALGADRDQALNPGKFVHNFNVRTSKSPLNEETAELRKARLEAVKTMFTDATSEVVEINGTKIVKYIGKVKVGLIETKILGYQVGVKGTDYTFTFTSNEEMFDKIKPEYEKMMNTVVFN